MYMSMSNSAPKKIYLHIRPNKEIGCTWHGNKIGDTDIEYTRTDAFVERLAMHFAKNAKCLIVGVMSAQCYI